MRGRVLFVYLVTAGILAACAASPAGMQDARPITKIEARSVSEERLKSLMLSQLGSILNEYPRPQQPGGPKHILDDLSYWTVPRAGETRNVCRYDEVDLLFTPVHGTKRNARTPVRMSGINARPFFFLTAPVAISDEGNLEESELARYDAACSKFTPFTVNAVRTESETLLIQVAYWLRRIKEIPYKEYEKIETVCSGLDVQGQGPSCATIIRSLEIKSLWEIRPCLPHARNTQNESCVKANFNDAEVTFYLRRNADLPHRIEHEEMIVHIRERID